VGAKRDFPRCRNPLTTSSDHHQSAGVECHYSHGPLTPSSRAQPSNRPPRAQESTRAHHLPQLLGLPISSHRFPTAFTEPSLYGTRRRRHKGNVNAWETRRFLPPRREYGSGSHHRREFSAHRCTLPTYSRVQGRASPMVQWRGAWWRCYIPHRRI